MAYTVLARRYRSSTFDEVIGQNHVAQTLKKAIASGRIAHAYLFSGTRGVGKTSMARILAKALNCEKSDGPTTEPCLKCRSCTAIATGEDIDVIEIDAASNTKVEDTRSVILDNAQYRPARSRFKIYIIDEVHMLSKSSFNALLKTLEEPPEHVKFILATTEPEKVLPTIHSRCQRYDFRNIRTPEIAGHLKAICAEEKIKADADALLMVAKAGSGSMRDSLSLLDRLLSIGEKHVTIETVEQLLGLPKVQLMFDLAGAIGEGRVKDVLEQVERILLEGMSADSLLVATIDHLRTLLIVRTCGMDSGLVEVPGLSPKDLRSQAERFDSVVLTQDITILEELRRQLRTTQAGRALIDATLVRLTLAEQFTQIGQLIEGVGSGAIGAGEKKKPDDLATKAVEDHSRPFVDEPAADVGPPEVEVTAPEIAAPILPAGELTVDAVRQAWAAVVARLAEQSPGQSSILQQVTVGGVANGEAELVFPADVATFASMWSRNGRKDSIRDMLTAAIGQPVGVRLTVGEQPAAPPALPAATPAASRPTVVTRPPSQAAPEPAAAAAPLPPGRLTQEQKDEICRDPLVKAIVDVLGGEVIRMTEE